MTTLEGSGSALELHPRDGVTVAPGLRPPRPAMRRGGSDTGVVPGIVDPRPARDAAIRAKRAELAAATDDTEKARLQGELTELEHEAGQGRGFVRRLLLGWGHRSVPW
jgi:hypothetical protein